uniref:Ig-like domain-containing protein n=1 Tax=Catharus ustulatus TaxID=91951 RepID=A0A8C3UDT7_CATUS
CPTITPMSHKVPTLPTAHPVLTLPPPRLLVEPPWTPAVLWDRVTLTCQGSGTAGDTTWYKDGRRWWQEGPDSFTVTESGTYQCQRPGTGLSPPVPPVPQTWLVLQVPARALLEGDTVTLRCRVWRDSSVTSVSFYRDGKELGTLQDGTELSLSPLQRNHSGRYHCRGLVYYLERWEQSEPVTVTVQGEHPTAATPTPPQPLPRHSGSQIPLPHLLPRALPGLPGSSRKGEWGAQTTLSPLTPTPKPSHCLPHIPFIPSGPPRSPRPPQRRGRCCTPTS